MTPATRKRMIIMLIIAGALMGAVLGFKAFKDKMIAKAVSGMQKTTQTVSTVVAKTDTWQPTVEAIGSLLASQQSSLSAETSGLVTGLHFQSGQQVNKGDVLVSLDASTQQAQLAQLEAQAALAEINLNRDRAQLEIQAVSQAVVDADSANLKSLQAQIKAQQALIAQKTISAPFSGKLGIRQANLGQYLAPGNVIATLQQLNPMEIDFTIPQSQISLIRIGMKAQVTTNAVPGKIYTATVSAIEPQIDPSTRNMKVRARVPNAHGLLLPGVFANIKIDQGKSDTYITLPNAAISYNPYGSTVYVIKTNKDKDGNEQQIAEQRFVTTGPTRGDQVAVLSGLKEGETVVTSGQLKLRNGIAVQINNSVQPSDNPNPTLNNH